MNTACPRRVSLITALDPLTILSPTIGATTGDRPAVRRFGSPPIARSTGFALRSKARPSTPTESSSRRLPTGEPALRTGHFRSVALHLVLPRRSYGSMPHDFSPQGSGLSPLWPSTLSGARARPSWPQRVLGPGGLGKRQRLRPCESAAARRAARRLWCGGRWLRSAAILAAAGA
jgi:hypothetical protein